MADKRWRLSTGRSWALPAVQFLAVMLTVAAGSATAEPGISEQRIELAGPGSYRVIDAALSGDEIIDYRVNGEQSQILSVDMHSAGPSVYFNVLPAGSDSALFIGSTAGGVADLRLPESGDYLVRVYQMRAAARRNQQAAFSVGMGIGAPEFADGLSGGPDYWRVSLTDGSALNLRSGPASRYPAIGVLRAGEALQNMGCRMTGAERWCRIRASASGLSGWAAGRYLREGPAPGTPVSMPGGPEGPGPAFDATGYLPCTRAHGGQAGQCPFGVIRQGRGDAGVWLVSEISGERHILFERGKPVAVSPAATFRFERDGDSTVIRLQAESFIIPDAVVFGA